MATLAITVLWVCCSIVKGTGSKILHLLLTVLHASCFFQDIFMSFHQKGLEDILKLHVQHDLFLIHHLT